VGEMNGAKLIVAPARPSGDNEDKRVCFETRRDLSGETVGLAFTSVGQLVKAMGEDQPWICLPVRTLKDFYAAMGINRLMVNAKFQGPAEGEKK
jgi:hypothetical protein